ncbi:hypothetical protein CUMW_114570 [Citrus unshiu]|nr:hypothetical protein CUMW_114570 [Citrus unshiu]
MLLNEASLLTEGSPQTGACILLTMNSLAKILLNALLHHCAKVTMHLQMLLYLGNTLKLAARLKILRPISVIDPWHLGNNTCRAHYSKVFLCIFRSCKGGMAASML